MTGNSRQSGFRVAILQVGLVVMIIAASVAMVSQLPVRQSESAPFASPVFQRAWGNDASAATGVLDLWGSEPVSWRVEPYFGAPNDRRVVQYFERGRMEVQNGSSEVTIGKLTSELVTGEIDLGNGVSQERTPSEIPVDSGEPDDRVPTYLTLNQLSDQPVENRAASSQRITEWIDRSGEITQPMTPEVRTYAQYVEETGRNLPDVTVELFNRPEFQEGRWIEKLGYPVSEPYWTEYRRQDGMLPSLIQVFERRILVYTPGLEETKTFTVASSGRHYSLWRYGVELDAGPVARPSEALDAGLTLDDDLEAWVYADGLGTPIDLALSPTGHLMILTSEGRILKTDSIDPNGSPKEISVWAEGIVEPQGMITRGDSVLVTADNRISWYQDRDGQGVLSDAQSLLASDALDADEMPVRRKPLTNSAGDVFTRIELNGSDDVLAEIASDEPLVQLDEVLDDPGPVQFVSDDLLVSGRNDRDRTSVTLLPSVTRSAAPSDPVDIAVFPEGTFVRAIAAADEELWDINELGEILIAVEDEDDARLFAVSRHQGTDGMVVVELARGLSRPTAIQVGLDGSIYVADADLGQIIRIRRTS